MNKTKIQWTETTWNPIRGCSPVSPGCANCYAMAVAARFNGPGQPYEGLATRDPRPRWTGEVRLVPERLADPLRWQRPRLVFVNSMSDLFHESLSNEQIAAIFGVMAAAPRHTFQVLTKRAARMAQWFKWVEEDRRNGGHPAWSVLRAAYGSLSIGCEPPKAVEAAFDDDHPAWPLPNVWIGVSAENQATAEERIPLLLECPAAVRWVSAEPLLGPIDFRRLTLVAPKPPYGPGAWLDSLTGHVEGPDDVLDARVDWIVVGGESGSNARPCDVAWIEEIVEDCVDLGVPVFVKQLGASIVWRLSDGRQANDPARYGTAAQSRLAGGVAHPKGGDPAEWPEALRVRQWPVEGLLAADALAMAAQEAAAEEP